MSRVKVRCLARLASLFSGSASEIPEYNSQVYSDIRNLRYMPFKHMSAATLQTLLNEQPITLIDIRDQASFLAGHIEGAIHIGNHNLEQFLADTDRALPLVVCCYHGNSSQGAADYFNQQGFEESYSLDGGFTAWPAN